MPQKLNKQEFASLMASMPGATPEEIIAKAREIEASRDDRTFVGKAADTVLPTALRVLGAVGGSVAGGATTAPTIAGLPAGVIAGGAAGAGLGEELAQGYEQLRGLRDPGFNWKQIATQSALGSIPVVGKAGKVLETAEKRALQGAAMGGAGSVATQLAEDEDVSLGNAAVAAGLGAALGGGAGALEARTLAKAKPNFFDNFSDVEKSPLLSDDYGILTWANPNNSQLADADNLARNAELERLLRAEGFEPKQQLGRFDKDEVSYLVPGMSPADVRRFGKQGDQMSVISREGYHRLADDATFPRQGLSFDQEADNYYSVIDLPDGRKVKYQMAFPEEAFAPAASEKLKAPVSVPLPSEGGPLPSQYAAVGSTDELPRLADRLQRSVLGAPSSAESRTASASAQSTPVEEMLQFEHRSPATGLTELDPARYGSAMAGAEQARKNAYPDLWADRSFGTIKGGKIESRFQGKNVYDGAVPKKSIYDLSADPDGILEAMKAKYPDDPRQGITAAEKAIKDAGYRGYRVPTHENPAMADSVVLFSKEPVSARLPVEQANAAAKLQAANEGPVMPYGGRDRRSPTRLQTEAEDLRYNTMRESMARRSGLASGSTAAGVVGTSLSMYPGKFSEDPEKDAMIRKYLALSGLAVTGGAAMAGFFPKQLGAKLLALQSQLKAQGLLDAKVDQEVRRALAGEFSDPNHAKFMFNAFRTIPLPQNFEGINFDKRGPLVKLLMKDGSDGVKLSKFTQQRLDKALEVGQRREMMWGQPEWVANLTNYDPDLAVKFMRLAGSFSPGTPTNANIQMAAEAFIRIVLRGEAPEKVIKTMTSASPMYPKNILPNLERVAKGGRIFGEKTEVLSGAELGLTHRIPIDVWLLRAMGSIEEMTPKSLRAYYGIEDAFTKWAQAKGLDPFVAMATVWNGIQDIAQVQPALSYREGVKIMGLPNTLQHPENQKYVLRNLPLMSQRVGKSRNQPPDLSIELPQAPDIPAPTGDLDTFKRQVRELMQRTRLAGDVTGRKPDPKNARIPRRS